MPVYLLLIFLHLFAIIWGINAGAGNANPVVPLIQFTFAVVVVIACSSDAAQRGTPIVHIGKFLMLVSWPVGAPIYLVWSRGWRGVLWSILWAFTLYVCFAAPAIYIARQLHRG